MDLIEALDVASDQLLQVASIVGDDQWTADTPCDGWTVRDLVDHLASGCAASAVAAHGAKREDVEAVRAVDHLGHEPVAGLRSCLQDQRDAFEAASRDQRVEYFPFPADIQFHLNMRIADVLIHTWDLAAAIGADDTLDPDVVEIVLNHYTGIGRNALQASGQFGTDSNDASAADVSPQQQLLALTGRSP